MKKILTTIAIIASMILTQAFACNKQSAKEKVRKAEELTATLYIYTRNIAQANNEARRNGTITPEMHKAVNTSIEMFLRGVDVYNGAVKATKIAVEAGGDTQTNLDILETILSEQVISSFDGVIDALTLVPAELWDKVKEVVTAARIALAAIKLLLAEMKTEARQWDQTSAA